MSSSVIKNTYLLTGGHISQACEKAGDFLTEGGIDGKDVLRYCLMLEEVLIYYQKFYGEEQDFTMTCRESFGRRRILIMLKGTSYDPFSDIEDEDDFLLRKLNVDSRNAAAWAYKNGVNRITFTPDRKRRLSSVLLTFIALILAVVVSLICMKLPEDVRNGLLGGFVSPTLDVILGVISAIAGPMIFFSLLNGICSIEDMNSLSRIGKKVVGSFMLTLIIFTVLSAILGYPFFGGTTKGAASFQVSEFYMLILGFIPRNIFEPFISGNTQQIIILAIAGGIILLYLGDRASHLLTFSEQATVAFQTIMVFASALIPVMVFLSIVEVILEGGSSEIAKIYKVFPLFIGICVLFMLIFSVMSALKLKVSVLLILRKSMPAFIRGFTTASSAAALPVTMEQCENSFGIDKKLVNFGVPIGQFIFKIGEVLNFVLTGYCLAELYKVSLSLEWVIMLVITAFILSIAAVPIAGGAVVCFSVMIKQLGLPTEAIGMALAINVVIDFFKTGLTVFCLQTRLILIADSLDMLDRDVLANESPAQKM